MADPAFHWPNTEVTQPTSFPTWRIVHSDFTIQTAQLRRDESYVGRAAFPQVRGNVACSVPRGRSKAKMWSKMPGTRCARWCGDGPRHIIPLDAHPRASLRGSTTPEPGMSRILGPCLSPTGTSLAYLHRRETSTFLGLRSIEPYLTAVDGTTLAPYWTAPWGNND